MSMNLEQFLEKLEQTPRDWYLDIGYGKVIRRKRGTQMQCPVTAVCGGDMTTPRTAGVNGGMPYTLAEDVAVAADSTIESELRAKLLKACGLA